MLNLSKNESDGGTSQETESVENKLNSNLQTILEEKNRIINKLKNQVHNQRIQLEFYIKKELHNPAMVAFAKKCLPELTDDNMSVVLAMNKFYKDLGMKSRIIDLYERICNIVGRTDNILETQEMLLNEIITNMRQCMNPDDIRNFLGNFDINTNYIELFNGLLNTTLSLKHTMHSFRSSCEHLVKVETQRNEIVKHVYSLPPDERAICNYLINCQMEKYELENIIKHILRKYKKTEPLVDEIDLIEKNLKLLHDTFKNVKEDPETGGNLRGRLERVYSQAMSLLAVSREQRDRYVRDMKQLKDENIKLRDIIEHIDGTRLGGKGADLSDVEKLHNIIKKTISEARKLEQSKAEELKEKDFECNVLKQKLSQVMMEKTKLQELLDTDSSENNENEITFASKELD